MESASNGSRLVLVGTWLGVRPGEGVRTALLFAYLLTASAVFILGRTVRDTLFLSRYSLSALPWMFVWYGAASALTVVLYSRVADRFTRVRVMLGSSAIVAVTYAATYVGVRSEQGWIYPTFYVWSEVAANLLIVQFWTLANDLHDPRGARRLFPTIGAARAVGVVLIGMLSSAIVRLIGTAQLLLILVVLVLVIAVLIMRLGREPRAEISMTAPRRGRAPRILGDRYVVVLGGFIFLVFAALTIGDFQFKIIAAQSFREDELARFFSLFYAGTGALSLAFQLFVTPRLLRRFGVGVGLAIMPGVFGLGSALLLGLPHLAVATAMKFADNGFQYTVHETSLQALYGPFPVAVKARTRALLDAVIKPVSYGCGGLLLVLLAPVSDVRWMSAVALVFVIGCGATIPAIRKHYVRTLERAMTAAPVLGVSPVFEGASATDALLAVLDRGEPHGVLAALEQLEGERSAPFVHRLERLAQNPDRNVRAAAIQRLADMRHVDGRAVLAALNDTDEEVRAAAAGTSARLMGDAAIDRLLPLIDDPNLDVRVATIAGLIEHCGIEGVIEGARVLDDRLRSDDPERREESALILRLLGRQAYRPVSRLLEDGDARVRRAALRAARHVGDLRLLPLLLDALGAPETRSRAASAIVAIGEPAVDSLVELLRAERTPRAIRLVVPRILREIPARRGYLQLKELAMSSDGHLRLRVLGALAVLARSLGIRERLAFVSEHVQFEVVAACRNIVAWSEAQRIYDTGLLREEFAFRRVRAHRRILRLLELRYDPVALRLVRSGIDRGRMRATALEVLDTVIEPRLRPLVMPFFEELTEAELVARARMRAGPIPHPDEFLAEQCRHPNGFVAACAVDAIARRKNDYVIHQATAAVNHEEPIVREIALRTLWTVDPERAKTVASVLVRDRDHVVISTAETVQATNVAVEELPMYSTLEKVLILKGTPLFSRVAAEDLAPLARLAEERSYGGGVAIVNEGERGNELFVVVRGAVAITKGGRTIATLGAGEVFGEIAVLDEGPRMASARAEGETEVLAVGSEEFYEVLYEQAEIAEGIIKMLVKRLRESGPVV